jgi:hypothetical protein
LSPSQVAFFGLTILLTVVLAYVALRMCGGGLSLAYVLLLAAMILASRPGHQNLLVGQATIEFVLAVYLAVHWGSRSPWLSGIALAIATQKPTFGVPLALLMISRRSYRPVAAGVVVGTPLTLAATAVLAAAAGGLRPLAVSFWEGYRSFQEFSVSSPVTSWSRVDLVALIGRLRGEAPSLTTEIGVFMMVVVLAALAMKRVDGIASGREATSYQIQVVSVAILLATYQQPYSLLLLTFPLTAVFLDRWAPAQLGAGRGTRLCLACLLAIPAMNYFATATMLRFLDADSWTWILVTSANGFALVLSFAVYVGLTFRHPRGDVT